MGTDGAFVRAFGRAGEGPGEFRSPDGLVVMRDGRVVIADLGHRAYHIFDGNGDFERMVRMAPEPGDVTITDLLPDPGGEAFFSAAGARTLSVISGTSPRTILHRTRPVNRIILNGEVAVKDTVAEGWLPPGGDQAEFGLPIKDQPYQPNFDIPLPRVFGPEMLAGALPDGSVAFSDSSAYSIKIARPGEGVWRILRLNMYIQFVPLNVRHQAIRTECGRASRSRQPGMWHKPLHDHRLDTLHSVQFHVVISIVEQGAYTK